MQFVLNFPLGVGTLSYQLCGSRQGREQQLILVRCTHTPLEWPLSVVLCDAAHYKEHCVHLGVCGSLFCLDFLIFNT